MRCETCNKIITERICYHNRKQICDVCFWRIRRDEKIKREEVKRELEKNGKDK